MCSKIIYLLTLNLSCVRCQVFQTTFRDLEALLGRILSQDTQEDFSEVTVAPLNVAILHRVTTLLPGFLALGENPLSNAIPQFYRSV